MSAAVIPPHAAVTVCSTPEELAIDLARRCVQPVTLDRMNVLFKQMDTDG